MSEPVAVVNVMNGGIRPVVSWLRAGILPAGSHKLYTDIEIGRKDVAIAELVQGLKGWLHSGIGNSTDGVKQAHAYAIGQALIAKHDTTKTKEKN